MGFSIGFFNFLAAELNTSSVKRLIASSCLGSVTSVKYTCCILLAVGARWAASMICSSISLGTGRVENALFERRALHMSIICSGVG